MTQEHDYGFSAISDEEYNSATTTALSEIARLEQQKEEIAHAFQTRIDDICALVVPMLERLRDTASNVYIHWPNRRDVMIDMLARIEALKKGL